MMAAIHDKVNKEFGIEIKAKIKSRNYVNGRMVFIKLCRHKEYNNIEICEYLDINHSTITHLMQRFEIYMYQDDKLQEKYEKLYDFFMSFRLLQKVDELMHTIKNLENQIKELKLHNINPTKH